MKKILSITLLLAMCLGLLTGCKDATATVTDSKKVVFTIGKTTYTKGDLYTQMGKDDAANIIVTKALAYIADKEVDDSDKIRTDAEDRYNDYKKQIEDSGEDFEETIKTYGYDTPEDFMNYCIEVVKSEALIDKYVEANWDALLEEYAPLKARIISISASDDTAIAKKNAEAALEKIKNGESFEDVANEYSDTNSVSLAKETLYTRKSTLDYNVLQFLSTVNAPTLSEIITSQKGTTFYIVQVTNINSEQLKEEFIDSLEANDDFLDRAYNYYCRKYNFTVYDIDVYNYINTNYPSFLQEED